MIKKKLFGLGIHRTEPALKRTEDSKTPELRGSKQEGAKRDVGELPDREIAATEGSGTPPSRQGKIAGKSLIDRFLHKISQDPNLEDNKQGHLGTGDESRKLKREKAERVLSDFASLGDLSSTYKVGPTPPLVTPESEVGRHAIALLEDIRTSRINAENVGKPLQSDNKKT